MERQRRRIGKDESLDEMVARRNRRLVKLFTTNGYSIRLVGDDQKPAVILDERVVLSCFVKNFDLFFTKEPFSDEIIRQFKLTKDITVSKYEMDEAIEACDHRSIFKIRIAGTDLYLVGYNYLNQEDAIGRYPVFARHKPKVYFSKEKADEIAESLVGESYTVEII